MVNYSGWQRNSHYIPPEIVNQVMTARANIMRRDAYNRATRYMQREWLPTFTPPDFNRLRRRAAARRRTTTARRAGYQYRSRYGARYIR